MVAYCLIFLIKNNNLKFILYPPWSVSYVLGDTKLAVFPTLHAELDLFPTLPAGHKVDLLPIVPAGQ